MRRRGERVETAVLVAELVGLVPVAGWQYRLGDVAAARSYRRVREIAAALDFPPPPPVERLADNGDWTPVDAWYLSCGID